MHIFTPRLKRSVNALLLAAAAATIFNLSSCSTPKDVTYLQDIQQGSYALTKPVQLIRAMPEDKLNILVHSKDPALSALFNLAYSQKTVGATNETGIIGSGTGTSLYTVDSDGNIDFPVIGKIFVSGLTREEIANKVKQELVSRNLILDPTVTVDFANPSITVLGEVTKPGRYNIPRDHLTILEGIAMAGDLTIQGERTNVTVVREGRDGNQQVYVVDLTSGANLYGSPAYYLQQNDIIYIEPNDFRKRQRNANGNSALTPTFWISMLASLASIATTITVLIVKK